VGEGDDNATIKTERRGHCARGGGEQRNSPWESKRRSKR